MRGNTVNLTDPSGRFADSNLWDLFSRIGGGVSDFVTHNEGARQTLDALGICPDSLSNGIRQLTGGMDIIFNQVADVVAPYAEAIAEIAVAAVVTSMVGPLAVGMGLGTVPAAVVSGMSGRVAGNLWSGRDWNYKVGDADAMIVDGFFGALVGVDGFADDWDDFARRGDDLAGACGVNSFSEDTTVATSDGDVPISDIEIGDTVLAYHEGLDETDSYTVTDTISHIDPTVVYLTISGETLTTTAEHPFYTSGGEWVNAGELSLGEEIRALDGSIGVVEGVEVIADSQPMYNLTVADAHTFFVGDGQWLVHNDAKDCIDIIDPNTGKNYKIGPYGQMPEPRQGTEAHHGVMSGWMKEHYPNYNSGKAPTVLLSLEDHNTTRRIFNAWSRSEAPKIGKRVDWAQVSETEFVDFSNRMFQRAGVPSNVVEEYWHQWRAYISTLR